MNAKSLSSWNATPAEGPIIQAARPRRGTGQCHVIHSRAFASEGLTACTSKLQASSYSLLPPLPGPTPDQDHAREHSRRQAAPSDGPATARGQERPPAPPPTSSKFGRSLWHRARRLLAWDLGVTQCWLLISTLPFAHWAQNSPILFLSL